MKKALRHLKPKKKLCGARLGKSEFRSNFDKIQGGVSVRNQFTITQGTDGTWSGFSAEATSFGSVSPAVAHTGQPIHAIRFDVAGNIIIMFGDAGNEQLSGISVLTLNYDGGFVDVVWDTVDSRYEAIDLGFTAWAGAFLVGEDYSFTVGFTSVAVSGKPENLHVIASDTSSVTLQWDEATDGDYIVDNYQVFAGDLLIGSPQVALFHWQSCPPNVEVTYRVRAMDLYQNPGPWSDPLVYTNVVPVVTYGGEDVTYDGDEVIYQN